MMRSRLTAATGLILALLASACTGVGQNGGLAALTPSRPADPAASAAAAPETQAFAQTPPATVAASTTAPTAAAANASATPAQPAKQAALQQDAKLAFAPILGATTAAMKPLSARLKEQAKAQGFSVVASGAKKETYLLQGYFSTVSDDKGTSIRYVWDVIDASGNRLNRISGAQAASGSTGSGWAAVTDADMQAVADQTIGALRNWLTPKKS